MQKRGDDCWSELRSQLSLPKMDWMICDEYQDSRCSLMIKSFAAPFQPPHKQEPLAYLSQKQPLLRHGQRSHAAQIPGGFSMDGIWKGSIFSTRESVEAMGTSSAILTAVFI